MEIWLGYDFRAPSGSAGSAAIMAEAIEQVAWADKNGFTSVMLAEHHATSDGYLPSPYMAGAAMAARSNRVRLMVLTIMPLLDPVRVAEDASVLDVISNGRVDIAGVAGYVPSEFEMFGVLLTERAKRIEIAVEALRNAFTGEWFTFEGRKVRVTPRPSQPQGPPIYLGGGLERSAKRAARLADGFWPTLPEDDLFDVYKSECRQLGRPAGPMIKFGPIRFVHVAEDPEQAAAAIEPYILDHGQNYARLAADAAEVSPMRGPFGGGTFDRAALASSGMAAVVTPAECVALALRHHEEGRVLSFRPLTGGMPPDLGWASLELFGAKVVPKLKELLGDWTADGSTGPEDHSRRGGV